MVASYVCEDGGEPMTCIVLVGLNHRTAPIGLREQLSLAGCSPDTSLRELSASSAATPGGAPLREVVLLSTCNRLVDLAVPRDVEERVAELPGVQPWTARTAGTKE